MGEEKSSTVKLFGMWASPYVLRAKLGLKLKGIEYENIEEDLSNKSELLMIQYNPVHNKVPVLVHNGLPIVDSSIILEYIDETWTQPPHLLPKDPYLRAKHRFWAAYLQQVAEKKRKLLSPTIEAKESEEIIDEYKNNMDVAEQLIKEILPNNQVPCFQDGSSVKPGYLDIILYSLLGNSDLADELFGCKPFTEERYPFLSSWVNALSQVPEFKELTPPKSKLNEVIRAVRNNKVPRSQQRLNIYKAAFATFKSFNSQPNNV